MSTLTATPAAPSDPAERILELRTAIDACDAEIIALVQRRLAISKEIGSLRAAAGGTRLSLSREQQVLARFGDALGTGRRRARDDAAPPGPRPPLTRSVYPPRRAAPLPVVSTPTARRT